MNSDMLQDAATSDRRATGEVVNVGFRQEKGVFPARLDAFLDQLNEGETPNAGRFCAFCYNPLPPDFQRCDHCGQDLQERRPLSSLPTAIIEMHRRRLRRESLIVNAFAYLGLGLGLAVFLGLVAVNVLLLNRELWFFVMATLVFLLGSRLLAGLLGGVIGDEVAYRYASRRLAEDWTKHLTERESNRQE